MRLMGRMGMISNGIRYFEMKYPINYEAVIKIYQSCRKSLEKTNKKGQMSS